MSDVIKKDLIKQAMDLINSTKMGAYLSFYGEEISDNGYGCGCCSTGLSISKEDEISSIDSMITEHKEVIEKLEKAKLLLIDARK